MPRAHRVNKERAMLQALAMAADPFGGTGARHLVRALTEAVLAGEVAEEVCWQLEQRISRLVQCKHGVTRSGVRNIVHQIAKECDLTLLRLGLDTVDDFPSPATLVQVAKKLYPPKRFRRVADVAGGEGRFTTALRRAGYKVTIIDPYGSKRKGLRVRRRKFRVSDADDFDLLFAFRPCRASRQVVRAAKRKPLLMVPCSCRSVWPADTVPFRACAAFFRELEIPFRRLGLIFVTGEEAMRRGAMKELKMQGAAA